MGDNRRCFTVMKKRVCTVEADEKKRKQNIQWTDYNLETLLTHNYNNKMVSSTAKMTLLESRKKKNEFEVKLNVLYRQNAIEHAPR